MTDSVESSGLSDLRWLLPDGRGTGLGSELSFIPSFVLSSSSFFSLSSSDDCCSPGDEKGCKGTREVVEGGREEVGCGLESLSDGLREAACLDAEDDGTGVVPPDNFTLHSGDEVRITIAPIGTLINSIA